MRYFTLSAPPRGTPGFPSDGTTAAGLLPVAAGASPKALKWGFWGAPGQLCGQPGTRRIAAPRPALDRGSTSKALKGLSSSSDAPEYFYPCLYYVEGYQEHAPVSLQRTNNMPVPAVDVYDFKGLVTPAQQGGTNTFRLAQIAMRSWHVGGRKAVPWPPAPQRWGSR